ncbi:Protein-tyrosine phosphatase, low molecular weight [Ammonifex degensii KC4]|uniref:Protein-tyrosine phosphatase, low molecular weight n=1 Tax=Ammonifex degensii (strain DSM 10501 / KC4) TaxID=429009 RepID=C9R9N5_AMMDK|nr:arsenate reductase ArsC [Ammonifex degensii]ACX53014.1 Protein-tyrosine phosphatase, low molecular weight [Ammonifex degensii KC4]
MAERRPLKVLFLCTQNSCRSQMAEGWARHLKAGVLEPYSAGTAPTAVHPLAIKVMAEAGVDISGQRAKHIDELRDIEFDLVVTLCDSARESCPVPPRAKRVIHRSFPDPAKTEGSEEEVLAAFRHVRDLIRDFIAELE